MKRVAVITAASLVLFSVVACQKDEPGVISERLEQETPGEAILVVTPSLSEAFVASWLERHRQPVELVERAAGARDWYVGINGSEDGDGTEFAPLRSIQAALDRAEPGDRIKIGPGNFNEQLVIRRGGTADRPLIVEGTRDAEGNHLTVLSTGVTVDPLTWEPVDDIALGVFRNEQLPFEPLLLAIDGKFVTHIHADNWTRNDQGPNDPRPWWRESNLNGDPMALIRLPDDAIVSSHSTNNRATVRFWDALGGVFVFDPDRGSEVVYLRLKGGVDPRKHSVTVSRGGAVVSIDNAAYVVLRGLKVEMGHMGISVRGASAVGNIIEECHIRHCPQRRIQVSHRASGTVIRNNYLAMGFYGARPGAWGGGGERTGNQEYLYDVFKRLASKNEASSDRSIYVENGARDTTIVSNHLDGGLVAISSSGNTGLVVAGNVINDFSSVGLSIITGSMGAYFHDNLIYNCNINMRLHRLNQGNGHEVYIFRNLLLQPEGVGGHVYTHSLNASIMKRMNIAIDSYAEPEIALYQNTFIGGRVFWTQTSGTGMRDGLPGIRLLNNVVAIQSSFSGRIESANFAAFDYNALVFPKNAPELSWFGKHNINLADYPLAPSMLLSPDMVPTELRNKGIDLSKPFTINSTTFDPLPGMQAGYFNGNAPNIGAFP